MRLISEKGKIYQMNLGRKVGIFKHLKYTNIYQIGRYYALKLNNKVTRLYTTVNFLVEENLSFSKKIMKFYANYPNLFED